jgi:translocation and assembly module TamA
VIQPLRLLLLPVLLLVPLHRTAAQEPPAEQTLPYSVEIVPTGDAALDAALAASSQLERLRERAPTDALGVVGRARGDLPRLEAALRSEGYWGGEARIELDGVPLGAAGETERLVGRREELPVHILALPRDRYRLTEIAVRAISPEGEAAVRQAAAEPFGLAVGDPARAAAVLDAEQALVDRLRRQGHPLATKGDRRVVVDHDRKAMEVAFVLAPGPRAEFAAPEVVGQSRTHTGMLEGIARRIEGQPYSPERVDRVRRDLLALGVFDSVRARAAGRLDPDGRLPVRYEVQERPLRAIGIAGDYVTNFGLSGRVYWEHRNLLGGAERLRLEAEVSRLGSDVPENIGVRAGGSLRTPWMFGRQLTLVTEAFLIRERLLAYDRDVVTASALFERKLSDRLTLQAGPVFESGRVGRDGVWQNVTLYGFQTGLRWDGTDSLLDPTRGIRAAIAVTPFYDAISGAAFTRARVDASTYVDLRGDRRSVLALRGAAGSAIGADLADIPFDQRFYAGGGGSVRGYDYQSIGAVDAEDRPIGGASVVEASLEFRQRVWGEFGLVAFVDAGAVNPGATPSFSGFRVGAGLGLRYLTGIGPLRADLALPLVKQEGSGSYGLYIGLGQAF